MVLRLAHQFERRARDDSGGALRADDGSDQIVAASLLGRSAELDDFAVGQNEFEREHVIGRDAVLERMRTAGILGDIAADGARDLRGRIGRVEKSIRLDRVGDVQIDDAALDFDAPVLAIDFQDPIHLRGADHRGCVQRKASTGKAGTGAARNERDAAAMQRRKHGADLRRRARKQQHVGDAFLDGPSVALVHLELGRARNNSVSAENFAKFAEKVAVDGVHC